MTSGYAQAQSTITGKIGFPFKVGTKALPAGQYDFVLDTASAVVRVVSGGKHVALVPIITRLSGAIHTTPKDSHLVFDKVGDTPLAIGDLGSGPKWVRVGEHQRDHTSMMSWTFRAKRAAAAV